MDDGRACQAVSVIETGSEIDIFPVCQKLLVPLALNEPAQPCTPSSSCRTARSTLTVWHVNQESRDEIAASVAAHAQLGPRYDDAVAEGLVERIGEEIDKRVEARLRGLGTPSGPGPYGGQSPYGGAPYGGQTPYGGQGLFAGQSVPQQYAPSSAVPPHVAPAPAVQHRGSGVAGVVLGLGSIALGAGGTSAVVSGTTDSVAKVFIVLLIWLAVAVVNVAHARRR